VSTNTQNRIRFDIQSEKDDVQGDPGTVATSAENISNNSSLVSEDSSKQDLGYDKGAISPLSIVEKIVSKYRLPSEAVQSYLDSYHGLAGRLGSTTVANCSDDWLKVFLLTTLSFRPLLLRMRRHS